MKLGNTVFWCVVKLKLFAKISDTHNKLQYVNNYIHWKYWTWLHLNYVSFSYTNPNPNPTHLPRVALWFETYNIQFVAAIIEST